MRRFWQTQWHGIPFWEFAVMDPGKIADTEFYTLFYETFFHSHKDWGDLDKAWLRRKETIAEYLWLDCSRIPGHPDIEVLSIGCGLGAIERYLYEKGLRSLSVTETSDAPLKWLRESLPPENIHVGCFPECIPPSKRFDLIFLSAVDYALTQLEFVRLLEAAKGLLEVHGTCVVVSASFDGEQRLRAAFGPLAELTLRWLDMLHIRPLGQFWGYRRNRRDYQDGLRRAGFEQISDGFLDKSSYFIKGKSK